MELSWRLDPPVLYERCDGVVRLRDIRVDGVLQSVSDLAGAAATFVMKPDEADPDDSGSPYGGTVVADPDDPDRAAIVFPVPAADLEEPGERWGYAVLEKDGKRYALGRGPVFVLGL